MASRDELEQDLQIVEAELEDAKRRIFDLQTELDVARGATIRVTEAAKEAGVELAIAKTPAEAAMVEVDNARRGLADEMQAIAELHAPPEQPDKPMSTLDHVRAANAKTDELGKRLAAAGTLVNRIAAILGVTSWDAEGTELRDPIQRFMHLGFFVGKRQAAVTKEIEKLGGRRSDSGSAAAAERNELVGWQRALGWFLEQIYASKTDADAEVPLSAPDGLYREQGDGTETRVRRFEGGDAGDVEVLICRGDAVVRRAVVSALQLNILDYYQRTDPSESERRMDIGSTPYR